MLARLMLIAGLFLVAFLPGSANADRRVALVVGNSAYASTASLRNPRNDASDMAETLKKLGFEVELGLDLDQQNFAVAIEKFARALDGADVGLFFYAGHGLQLNDKNYLVSINAKLENEFLMSSETIDLTSIVRLMESKTAVNLVFLDACRNNPLAENLRRGLEVTKRSANLGRGLARIEPASRDTLIAFAAAPGQVAADGNDRNSPFTASLLKNIPRPAVEVSVMLKEVSADVRRDTNNSQRPQQLSDMSRTFYFAKLEQPAVAKGRSRPPRPTVLCPAPPRRPAASGRAVAGRAGPPRTPPTLPLSRACPPLSPPGPCFACCSASLCCRSAFTPPAHSPPPTPPRPPRPGAKPSPRSRHRRRPTGRSPLRRSTRRSRTTLKLN